jgi:trehalose 6-phosphate phosphatase
MHSAAPQETRDQLNALIRKIKAIPKDNLALFFDYDGTLVPIVADPAAASMHQSIRQLIGKISRLIPTSIVTGRDLVDIQNLVAISSVHYAGCHGYQIRLADQRQFEVEIPAPTLADLEASTALVSQALHGIAGVIIQHKKFAKAIHYRQVPSQDIATVKERVQKISAQYPRLRLKTGKMLFELQPAMDWHKGKAVDWILAKAALGRTPIYFGDDVTDEDAYRTLQGKGICVYIGESPSSLAHFTLGSPKHVEQFIESIL